MTGNPWDLPADHAEQPRVCHVCGESLRGGGSTIAAIPYVYHVACYERFHAAMNDRANLDKTIEEIRAVVVAAKGER
jgi:hypothetical protein